MGLDLYAGPLCRYYGGDWETAVQQWGREQGVPVEVLRPGSAEPSFLTRLWRKFVRVQPPPKPEDPRPKIEVWRQQLAATGRFGTAAEWQWPETFDAPYETVRPNFDGWGALQTWAAYAESGSPPSGPLDLDNAMADARFNQLYLPELWVPPKFSPIAQGPLPVGGEGWIGSVPTLLAQLEELNAASGGLLAQPADDVDHEDVARLARWGYGIVHPLVRFAAAKSTPFLLDY